MSQKENGKNLSGGIKNSGKGAGDLFPTPEEEQQMVEEYLRIEGEVARLRLEEIRKVDPKLAAELDGFQSQLESGKMNFGAMFNATGKIGLLETAGEIPNVEELTKQARKNLGLRLN